MLPVYPDWFFILISAVNYGTTYTNALFCFDSLAQALTLMLVQFVSLVIRVHLHFDDVELSYAYSVVFLITSMVVSTLMVWESFQSHQECFSQELNNKKLTEDLKITVTLFPEGVLILEKKPTSPAKIPSPQQPAAAEGISR